MHPPVADQQRQERPVGEGPGSVLLALIPGAAADRKGDQRMDHPSVECTRRMGRVAPRARRPRGEGLFRQRWKLRLDFHQAVVVEIRHAQGGEAERLRLADGTCLVAHGRHET